MQKAINRMVLTLWISFPIYAVFATPERIEPDTYELMHMNINKNLAGLSSLLRCTMV